MTKPETKTFKENVREILSDGIGEVQPFGKLVNRIVDAHDAEVAELHLAIQKLSDKHFEVQEELRARLALANKREERYCCAHGKGCWHKNGEGEHLWCHEHHPWGKGGTDVPSDREAVKIFRQDIGKPSDGADLVSIANDCISDVELSIEKMMQLRNQIVTALSSQRTKYEAEISTLEHSYELASLKASELGEIIEELKAEVERLARIKGVQSKPCFCNGCTDLIPRLQTSLTTANEHIAKLKEERDRDINHRLAEAQSSEHMARIESARYKAALEDIEAHSKAPFVHVDPRNNNWKWLNYVNDVAVKALEPK